uniref:Uncharacterized protein n=1 Tax=Bursaphelenchus xylophilus TaxID=6326 RepID=A0A1I7RVM4_BURXY
MKRVQFDLPDLSRPVTPTQTPPPQFSVKIQQSRRPRRRVNRPKNVPIANSNYNNFYGHFVDTRLKRPQGPDYSSDGGYYRERIREPEWLADYDFTWLVGRAERVLKAPGPGRPLPAPGPGRPGPPPGPQSAPND